MLNRKNKLNVLSLLVIKRLKMVDLCFGALALNVVLKNIDLLVLKKTSSARTRCGRI